MGDLADRPRLMLAHRGLLLALAGPIGGGAELLGQHVHLGDAGAQRLGALATLHGARDPDERADRAGDPPAEHERQRAGERRRHGATDQQLPERAAQRRLDGRDGRGDDDPPARERRGGERDVHVLSIARMTPHPALVARGGVLHAPADHLLLRPRAGQDHVLTILERRDRAPNKRLRAQDGAEGRHGQGHRHHVADLVRPARWGRRPRRCGDDRRHRRDRRPWAAVRHALA